MERASEPALPASASLRAHPWLRLVTLLLIVEKVIQHVAVTGAFIGDFGGIRARVALDYRVLLALGVASAALFALAGWALVRGRSWANSVLIALAMGDIVGEFVAQGTLAVAITVSFLVATALLGLAIIALGLDIRRGQRAGRGPGSPSSGAG
jgi:hypothetical protein